eukprot:3711241-Pleurochrysis_carterae.AAC.1
MRMGQSPTQQQPIFRRRNLKAGQFRASLAVLQAILDRTTRKGLRTSCLHPFPSPFPSVRS